VHAILVSIVILIAFPRALLYFEVRLAVGCCLLRPCRAGGCGRGRLGPYVAGA
jgi:hypothetical protein